MLIMYALKWLLVLALAGIAVGTSGHALGVVSALGAVLLVAMGTK